MKKNPISPNRINNNSIANELKGDVTRFTTHIQISNQVAASYKLREY